MKMTLEKQIDLLNQGHPVHIDYLEKQIKDFVNLDLEKYMEFKGKVHSPAYNSVINAIDRSCESVQNSALTVGSAAKELWSLVVDEDIPDDVYEDRIDIYEGVYSLSTPFAWRRKEPRSIHQINK